MCSWLNLRADGARVRNAREYNSAAFLKTRIDSTWTLALRTLRFNGACPWARSANIYSRLSTEHRTPVATPRAALVRQQLPFTARRCTQARLDSKDSVLPENDEFSVGVWLARVLNRNCRAEQGVTNASSDAQDWFHRA